MLRSKLEKARSLPGVSIKFKDLQKATNGFSEENLLGEGSFGKVYKGVLVDPAAPKSMWGVKTDTPRIQVAVKKLDPESFQGYHEWLAEVLLLNKLQHPNLVSLAGYCNEKNQQCLVYELCPHGSLEDTLFHSTKCPLDWELRVEVALGAARGLAFLHKNNFIHRDFKTSNVLLAEGYQVRVTDFGLAKAGPAGDKTHVSTRVLGTLGYLDPTYMETVHCTEETWRSIQDMDSDKCKGLEKTGRLTAKSDTFAFGVMLLELITGRPSMNDAGTISLAAFMRPHLAERRPDFRLFTDPRLGDSFSKPGMFKMAILAKYCIHDDPTRRPEMDKVVENLEKIEKDE